MHIWVDADACPKPVKEMIFRAAQRTQTSCTLVANHALTTPAGSLITSIQVPAGFDVADNYIVQGLSEGDLVVTQDIPLAAEIIEKKGIAINPRGELYTIENMRQRLNMRDFMEELRSTGQITGGPGAFGNKEKQAFANSLDKVLAKSKRRL